MALTTSSSVLRGSVSLIDVAPLFLRPPPPICTLDASRAWLLRRSEQSIAWSGATSVCLPPYAHPPSTAVGASHGVLYHVQDAADVLRLKEAATPPPPGAAVLVDYPLTTLGSNMMYGRTLEAVQAHQDYLVALTLDETSLPVVGWLRSALGCRFEGSQVNSIAAGEGVCRLLSIGCQSVVVEEGIGTLTPRWLEIFLKTAVAIGASPAEHIGVSLAANEDLSASVVHAALAFGVTTLVGSSFAGGGGGCLPVGKPFQGKHTLLGDRRLPMDELLSAVLAYKDQSGAALDDEELVALQHSRRYCASLSAELAASE